MGKTSRMDDYTREFAQEFAQLRESAEKIPNVKAVLDVMTHVQTVTAPILHLNSSSSVSPRFGSVYSASTTKAI